MDSEYEKSNFRKGQRREIEKYEKLLRDHPEMDPEDKEKVNMLIRINQGDTDALMRHSFNSGLITKEKLEDYEKIAQECDES